MEFVEGNLLGDGCVHVVPRCRNARYSHGSKYREFLKNYIKPNLEKLNIIVGPNIREAKTIINNCVYSSYHLYTRVNPLLTALYRKWYGKGKKCVPNDIELTPVVCREWYIGDGSLVVRVKIQSRPYIRLATNGFDKDSLSILIEKLVKFEATGCQDGTLYIPSRQTKDFLDFIGPCPEGAQVYQYKWNPYLNPQNKPRPNPERIIW